MSTESLIVELDAKTQKMDAKLRATEKRLDELDGTVKKTDTSLGKMSKVAGGVGTALVKTTAVVVALGAAIGAIVLNSANSRKELEQFARQAKTTEENFQALAFATKQYGINAEQIADISKDVSDKVSEFAIAGTGAFQDYADSIKLTKEEAREAAIEFTKMSSEEVIGKMVSEMEKAGLSASDMTFALESIGNDLSKLQPLLANNSAELKTMKDRFDSVNSTLQITAGQAEKLKEVSTSFDLLTSSLGNSATAISATLAPTLNTFINDIINITPNATQAIIDLTNSFLDAENISSQAGVLKEITESQANLVELELRLADAKAQTRSGGSGLVNTAELQISATEDLIEKEKLRTEQLNEQLKVLKEQKISIEDAKRQEGGEIGGDGGGEGGGASTIGSTSTADINAIRDRFKSEIELLEAKLEKDKEKLDNAVIEEEERQFLLLDLLAAFEDNKIAIKQAAADKELLIQQKEQAKLDKEKAKSQKVADRIAKENADRNARFAQNSMALAAFVFEDNKAVSAGIALVNTAQGVTKALATQDYAGAALTAVMGAAQIQSILNASKGGGSVSTPVSAPPASTPDFVPEEEVAGIELTEQSSTGVSTQRIIISTDDGNDIFDGIAQGLESRARQGA